MSEQSYTLPHPLLWKVTEGYGKIPDHHQLIYRHPETGSTEVLRLTSAADLPAAEDAVPTSRLSSIAASIGFTVAGLETGNEITITPDAIKKLLRSVMDTPYERGDVVDESDQLDPERYADCYYLGLVYGCRSVHDVLVKGVNTKLIDGSLQKVSEEICTWMEAGLRTWLPPSEMTGDTTKGFSLRRSFPAVLEGQESRTRDNLHFKCTVTRLTPTMDTICALEFPSLH